MTGPGAAQHGGDHSGSGGHPTRAPSTALLISTYDLGRQPFGLASAAAWLSAEGFSVTCRDTTVESLEEAEVRAADLIGLYLPMHAATRGAARLIPWIRALNPAAHLCAFGLYAPMNQAHLRDLGVASVLGAEFETALAALARRLARGEPEIRPAEPILSHPRQFFRVPDRRGLPALDRYAALRLPEGGRRVVGFTETSRGCKHLCRHCPVVPVYQGRFRVIQREVVLEDIRRQVDAGAEHISFGDPDFWNGIGHALPIVERLHAEHLLVTYDATIKIEHLLRHREHLPTLARTGCSFVTSAVESLDDAVLAKLDKGHTRADFLLALGLCRAAGVALQPTFVAFHPWTSLASYRDLLATLADLGLTEAVAPVQLAIRLLIPAGSRLLELEEMGRWVGRFDPVALVHPWRHPDPAIDRLQREVESAVREAVDREEGRPEIFERVWDIAWQGGGAEEARAPVPRWDSTPIPYLTEPWYC